MSGNLIKAISPIQKALFKSYDSIQSKLDEEYGY